MIIKQATFLKSSAKTSQCPPANKPEYAFIGRSNVGKSSLINMLVDRKDMAKTSGRPGKTQLVNHFEINEEWYLVDLPGYGYAKVSKGQRRGFEGLITSYIQDRSNLINLFVLIDCRLEPQAIDLEFMQWLGENGVPFSMVFTKLDKLSSNQFKKALLTYNKRLLMDWEEVPVQFYTSATSKIGRTEILEYISNWNSSLKGVDLSKR